MSEPMTEARAQEILKEVIVPNGRLVGKSIQWPGWFGRPLGTYDWDTVELRDGTYTADDLEAIAWWMRNKGPR